jgi:hypothetical protein
MASIDWGLIQRDPVTKWLPIAIKANNHDLLGYVLGNTTDLSDNDIEGYQIACSCGNIRMLRRLVEPNGRSSGGFGRQYRCPDIIEYLNGLRSGNE